MLSPFPGSVSSDNMEPGDTETRTVHCLMEQGREVESAEILSLSVTIVLNLGQQNETMCWGVTRRVLALSEWKEPCFELEACMKIFNDECF